jgi:hypothetical protein
MYHYTDGPPQRVVGQWLQGSQTPHGDAVAIHDIEGLTETLCKTFVQKLAHCLAQSFATFARQAYFCPKQPWALRLVLTHKL